ncbi:MAG: 3-deoxy-manno-octulosonate cytidylyltransferase (EC [uncultured Campylobacterales bacterium]|uniref:3-deoxy-manno-octulosonate cytidylyltransferase (EC) n=1 Tax=uncultured Campylobacterales bacterium TaxID=352960 RepID=A0A6S6SJP2_9BACT|nr:MAG: 3-deoxy-manno-octulosonate cytidylyltransferase (EC [uncultured Campylobacterales bacterium]
MIIIPARLGSTRFPKKILAKIGKYPMVVATAKRVESVDDVIVATDSEEVKQICAQYGVRAELTSVHHQSGTDRINEVVQSLGIDDNELVINVQADEPFIEPEILKELITKLKNLQKQKRDFIMASCAKSISKDEAKDPNLVKVILDKNNDAIYFSRSIIPYDRDSLYNKYLGHIGIYGFDAKSLNKFCSMQGTLEHIEKLEQLRVLENAQKIAIIEVKTKSFGIDTLADLQKALLL